MNWYKKSNSYSGIFDTTTTGMSYYDQLMTDDDFADGEGKSVKIMFISPDEYENRITAGFWNQSKENRVRYVTFDNFFNEFIKSKRVNKSKVLGMLESARKGDLFPMPVIEYYEHGIFQEGHHRVKVAALMGETSIPVLIINDENRVYPIEDYGDESDLAIKLEKFLQYNQIDYSKQFLGIDLHVLSEFLDDGFLERGNSKDKWEFTEARALESGRSVIISPTSEEGIKSQRDSDYAYDLAIALKEKFKSNPLSFVQLHDVDKQRVEYEISRSLDLEKFCKHLVNRLGVIEILNILRKRRDDLINIWGGKVHEKVLRDNGLDV